MISLLSKVDKFGISTQINFSSVPDFTNDICFNALTFSEKSTITLTPYMVLPLFATRFAGYAGGIGVSLIQPRLY